MQRLAIIDSHQSGWLISHKKAVDDALASSAAIEYDLLRNACIDLGKYSYLDDIFGLWKPRIAASESHQHPPRMRKVSAYISYYLSINLDCLLLSMLPFQL